jgi:hypothetical protein
MSFVGQVFRLFSEDLGFFGYAVLAMVALSSMWLGYRYSRPSGPGPSLRRPPVNENARHDQAQS